MPSAMASTSSGSTSTAAPPATSSVDVPALVTTGAPCDIASSTGSPKPSASLGYAKTVADAYSAGRSAAGTKPRNRTSAAIPSVAPPQPSGPATTSGSWAAARGTAAARRRRFLRGSSVPTNSTNRSGRA